MKEKTMMTQFIVEKALTKELYIYRIPECSMHRLQKGDIIRLRKYKRGNPFSDREIWEAVITDEPIFDISWSDAANTSMNAYDIDSVIPMQIVRVTVTAHRYV